MQYFTSHSSLTECQRLKANVVKEIRSNQQLEQDLDVMDIKIGLLVKNRITLQDVISTSQQQARHKDKKGNRHSQILEQGPGAGVGGLSKANHEKLEVRVVWSCDCHVISHVTSVGHLFWTWLLLERGL